ncbi:hypothetical protein DJ73_06265 [Halorubrum sp. Ea1]|uniref:class I SAM-dependent methyltransferase n=1 Tax=Halorubrum sp. Ea1 TaxID=1480718 RepID=UPI000B981537|nr:class I SAM-dependent methyltransferase [Halorubrum sp. Ea1]OYR53900.1 hypothetical protein DJ73_06265 [Halorubrum sp. Ea1]
MALDPDTHDTTPIADKTEYIYDWYENSRMTELTTLIDEVHHGGGRVASVGCGDGYFEEKYLSDRFDEVIGVEIVEDRVREVRERGIEAIHSGVPPMPFADNSLNAVVSLSAIEHFPDERGYIEEVIRCLKPGGHFFLNFPIEVGIGGFIRFLGKNIIHPEKKDTPNSWKRFTDYTWEELLKKTTRDKHGTNHRYYNYKFVIQDLDELFSEFVIRPWPVRFLGSLNIAFFARASL